ncbi:MAG: hypothetical protein KAX78_07490 [Phycisphaerae bacterium]|nr:hypothetical protein [Phycisphaerae bacterium]
MRVSLTTLLIVSCCMGAGTARAALIGLEAGKLDFHFINTAAVGDSTNPFAAGGGVLNLILEMGGSDSNPWPEDFTKS